MDMGIVFNPYVAGNPVGGSPAFVGRADIVREVLRVLDRPHSNAIVLYGQRRIGKTSILQHLESELPHHRPYHPVLFDLQDKAALPLASVLKDLARTIGYAVGRYDADLGSDAEATFRDTWLPTTLDGMARDHVLVLLLDEFDVLTDPQAKQAAQAFFPYLRTLLASDPQRLQFVFVVGRNIADLATIALPVFKGIPSQRISLLSRQDTEALIQLSAKNGSLEWPVQSRDHVWQLTGGHPFLTQQLCSQIWERAYETEPDTRPMVTVDLVDSAADVTLEYSRNALEWLWSGLGSPERIVASALAGVGPRTIDSDRLDTLLHESGVRIVIRELQNAPGLLMDWDILEQDAGGYRFRVELLRRWIADQKPLHRVQAEMDRIEPVAQSLYQAAVGLYQTGDLESALAPLNQAVTLNPNHVGANLLLSDILLAQGKVKEATDLLERLHGYQPSAARPRLVQALLTQAENEEREAERLALYERTLTLAHDQPEALKGRQAIWLQRGDNARDIQELETALKAYQNAGASEQAAQVKRLIQLRALASLEVKARDQVEAEQWVQAVDSYSRLVELAPDEDSMAAWKAMLLHCLAEAARIAVKARRWTSAAKLYAHLAQQTSDQENRNLCQSASGWCREEQELADTFSAGRQALERKDYRRARQALLQVVGRRPDYQQDGHWATELLDRAAKAGPETRRPREPSFPPVLLEPVAIDPARKGAGSTSLLLQESDSPKTHPIISTANAHQVVELATRDTARADISTVALGGTILALGGTDRIDLYRTKSLTQLYSIDAKSVSRLALSADGQILACSTADGQTQVRDIFTRVLRHECPGSCIALSPDGTVCASVISSGLIGLMRTSDGRLLHTLDVYVRDVLHAAFSRDSSILMVASTLRKLDAWSVERGSLIRSLDAHKSSVTTIAFSTEGDRLASGSVDRTVRLWDLPSQSQPTVLLNEIEASSLAFSPDGSMLAVGTKSGAVKLCSVQSSKVLHSWKGLAGQVSYLSFLPEGTVLLTKSRDRGIRLWGIESQNLEKAK